MSLPLESQRPTGKSHPSVEISPAMDTAFGRLGDIWSWRFLIWTLTVRDVKLRYKQTILGVGIVIVRPLVTAMIMAFVLGGIANLSSEKVPLFLFGLIGSVIWFHFSHAMSNSSLSLMKESEILTKVYVPHFVPVFSATLSSYVDFLVSFAVLLAYLAVSGHAPAWTIVVAPLIAVLTPISVLSYSLFLAPLVGLFRDFREIGNIILQFLLFLTPVYYPFDKVPALAQPFLSLNPALWLIEVFRAAVVGHFTTDPLWIAISFASSLVCCLFGLLFFRLLDRVMIDFL